MKCTTKVGLILWISLAGHVSALFAQTSANFPPNFCDPVSLESFCGPGTTVDQLDARYGLDASCLSNTSNNFPTTEGTTNCVPEFGGYSVKLAADDFFEQINSERSAWNKDSDIAFFRGPGANKITFFDENGDKLCSEQFKVTDFYSGLTLAACRRFLFLNS